MSNDWHGCSPWPILVTGAAGFIGRRVVGRLATEGVRVRGVDRVACPPGWPEGVEYQHVGAGEHWAGTGEDRVLVHLAWNMDRANPEAQAESLQEFMRVLGQGCWHRVVGLGSAEEYGELEGQLSEEMAPGLHLSTYGRAKHEAYRALEAWARSPDRRAVWLRPFIVYGPGQGGPMVIPHALRCARERRVAEFTAGLQRRDFIHVDDVAEGVVQAALRWPDGDHPLMVCNLGRGEAVRLRDVLDRMAGNMGVARKFHFGVRPMREGEPAEQYADVLKAEELGWKARIGWQQGIDALCQEALK